MARSPANARFRGFAKLRTIGLLFRLFCIGRFIAHPWHALIGALASGVGVALFFSVLILNASITGSFENLVPALRGEATLEVTDFGRGLVPVSWLDRLRKITGIKYAAPLMERPALLIGKNKTTRVTVVGVDTSVAGAIGAKDLVTDDWRGSGFLSAAVTEELRNALGEPLGAILTLAAGDRSFRITLGGVLRTTGPARSIQGRFIVVPLVMAQWLFQQPDAVTSILIAPRQTSPQSTDRLRRFIQKQVGDHLLVLPVKNRAAEPVQATALVRSFTVFTSLLALLIGSYLIFNSVAMRIRQERHEMGILLAIGESRQRLLFLSLMETGLMGAAGSAMGLPAGFFVGDMLVGSMPSFLHGVSAGKIHLVMPLWAPVLAAAMGIIAALAGSVIPALSVLKLELVNALRPQPTENLCRPSSMFGRSNLIGLAMIGCAVLIDTLTDRFGALPLALTFTGALGAIPLLFRLSVYQIHRASRDYPFRFAAGVMQAVDSSIQENLMRSTATMMATTLCVATVVAIGGASVNLADSIRPFAAALGAIDVYVSSFDDPYLSVPMSREVAKSLSSIQGIDKIYELRSMFVRWRGRRIWLRGDDPEAVASWGFVFTEGERITAARGINNGGILISTQIAHRYGLRRGDTVVLPSGQGAKSFHVVAVFESWSWPEGTFVISNEAFVRLYSSAGPNQLAIRVSTTAAKRSIEQVLSRMSPSVTVTSGDALRDRVLEAQHRQIAPFRLVRYVAVLMAAIMVLHTMMLNVFQRQREIGLLRAIGMSRRQLALSLFIEVGFLLVIAATAGLLLGALFQHQGISFVNAATGLPLRRFLTWQPLGEGLMAALIAAIAGAAYPAWRIGRKSIIDAISYGE
jgi:putative ABC transport system permease protein